MSEIPRPSPEEMGLTPEGEENKELEATTEEWCRFIENVLRKELELDDNEVASAIETFEENEDGDLVIAQTYLLTMVMEHGKDESWLENFLSENGLYE